jgi:hypothetical protein
VKVTSDAKYLPEHRWAVTETAWPSVIYLHVNGIEHLVRRKVHHGKDIPVDITRSLKEGVNEIVMTLLCGPIELDQNLYAMAIEILETANHERVRGAVRSLSKRVSIDQVRERLSNSNVEDDELTVVGNHITIDLVDPFMARIFDVPARTKSCSHRECFDLETFFSTRLSRAAKAGGMAEDWKCPICGSDARPRSLVIDEFLISVRSELEDRRQLDTKSILVKADGSWQAKIEESNSGGNGLPTQQGSSLLEGDSKVEPKHQGTEFRSSSCSITKTAAIIELD